MVRSVYICRSHKYHYYYGMITFKAWLMLFIPNSVMLCVTTWCAYNSDTGSSFCKHIFVTLTLANYVLKPNPGPYAYLWPWQRCISNPDPRHCHRHCHSTQPWNTVSYPILNESCLQLSVDLHSSFRSLDQLWLVQGKMHFCLVCQNCFIVDLV